MQQPKTRKYWPLVSIITVNYNHTDVTLELIGSLSKISYPNIEIIVVDNASPDDDPTVLKREYPGIVLVQNPINYGFAAGNNFGIMRARGKYVLLLNNDTMVDPHFMEPLVEKLENNPGIGAISPKIRYFHTPHMIQYAGYIPFNNITMRNAAIGSFETDRGQYDDDYETPYAHGAAMMVPMEVIKKIGLMSYIFFLYYEEADWCARITRNGYNIWYVHNSLVFHRESISTGRLSPMKIYYLNRNRLVYMRRNIFGRDFMYGIFYQLLIAIPKNAFVFLLKGRIKLFYAYYRAIGWHIKHLFSKEIHENPML